MAKIMRAAQGGVKWADLDRKDQQVHDECRGEGAEFCKLSSESLGITPQSNDRVAGWARSTRAGNKAITANHDRLLKDDEGER